MTVKPLNPERNQAGTTSEPVRGEVVPESPLPEREGFGTANEWNCPETAITGHDPSPWLTQEMAEEIAESMPTGYDRRGNALIPPRQLTVAEYRRELESLVERWGGYVWWVEGAA